MKADYEGQWEAATAKLRTEMKVWRDAHPHATFREIEDILEAGLAQVRAQMLADMATASDASEGLKETGEPVVCPQCGADTQRHGYRKRKLRGQQDAEVILTRRYLTCPTCGHGFSPSGH